MRDDVGNRTSVIESGSTSYSANNLNQYDYVGSVYYDYDLNGNTTHSTPLRAGDLTGWRIIVMIVKSG